MERWPKLRAETGDGYKDDVTTVRCKMVIIMIVVIVMMSPVRLKHVFTTKMRLNTLFGLAAPSVEHVSELFRDEYFHSHVATPQPIQVTNPSRPTRTLSKEVLH